MKVKSLILFFFIVSIASAGTKTIPKSITLKLVGDGKPVPNAYVEFYLTDEANKDSGCPWKYTAQSDASGNVVLDRNYFFNKVKRTCGATFMGNSLITYMHIKVSAKGYQSHKETIEIYGRQTNRNKKIYYFHGPYTFNVFLNKN